MNALMRYSNYMWLQFIAKVRSETIIDFKGSSQTRSTPSDDNRLFLQEISNIETGKFVYSAFLAKKLCDFMLLAYESEHIVQIFANKTQGMILYYSKDITILRFESSQLTVPVIVIACSGTDKTSLNDWWINITQTYKEEWEKKKHIIMPLIQTQGNCRIIVCGHSKGGMVALYMYSDMLQSDKFKKCLSGCYVAGTPDKLLNESAKQIVGVYNIKDRRDPIAQVLGSANTNWEVSIGNKSEKYDLSKHQIVSYISQLQVENLA